MSQCAECHAPLNLECNCETCLKIGKTRKLCHMCLVMDGALRRPLVAEFFKQAQAEETAKWKRLRG